MTERHRTGQVVLNILMISLLRASGGAAGIEKIVYSEGSVLFYPRVFDAVKMTKLAAIYNKRLLVSLGNTPYISLRARGMTSAEALKEAVRLTARYRKLNEEKAADDPS